jgi:2-polyprenyl-6-hydroxyphenyl methylase/3-demethylubiquinone-9 3-methyltransferase
MGYGMTEERFAFGKNWHRFVEANLNEERIGISGSYMMNFLELTELTGKSFLDIGSGSGIHSLAAVRVGANPVMSFDYDPDSVAATKAVKETMQPAADFWMIEQGSVLDSEYMQSLGQYDLVYSWGVLHHTGDQWTAIRNASERVATSGLFYLALYSADVQIDPPPEYWLEVKQRYVAAGKWKRNWMVLWYLWRFSLCKNPFRLPALLRTMKEYQKSRGMSYLTDVRDWIGGWPMEFSHDQDVIDLFEEELGFELVKIFQGEANTEYLFRRVTSPIPEAKFR